MTRKLVYRFESGRAEGRAEWRDLLGGKGANLAEMANMGIPVPPGFTIATEACVDALRTGQLPAGLWEAVRESMAFLEDRTGRKFGSAENPLLVSVRSGARSSMPGMMDTILNLGLNDETMEGLGRQSQSPRFALDAYRRLLAMFADVVLGVEHALFEAPLLAARRSIAKQKKLSIPDDPETLARLIPDSVLSADELREVVAAYKGIIREHAGKPFPNDPYQQLEAAIQAVFHSWNNPRAKLYRKMHGIPDEWGTAVNIQAMVFGNLGDTSATGVAFTRDPSTGERRFFGEWLPNAQGEDVVAGIRTPRPLSRDQDSDGQSLQALMPDSYNELYAIQGKLEHHFRDMQDIEFTIEAGKLYLLQTRNGKRSARASVRIAVDMVGEGLLHPDEAILRVDPERLSELLFPAINPKTSAVAVARGIAASPGAVGGKAVFNADDAEAYAARGEDVILIRLETSPEDLHGMKAAKGILTARGGATSHAAVVARGMGRPCVAGCSSLHVDYATGSASVHAANGDVCGNIRHGDFVTIDGSTGNLYLGRVDTVDATLGKEMETLLAWTERVSRMRVRANADTKSQAEKALSFGAHGIGLCRTEHMFFDDERIAAVREMILSRDVTAREAALAKLLPFQTEDFLDLFRVMKGKPVNIRLLDPPLHEFLPREKHQIQELAATMGVSVTDVERKIAELFEFNPMLGHRGVRLGITFPEIPAMQVRAILEAACTVKQEGGDPHPEIMIPLAFSSGELKAMRVVVDEVAEQVFTKRGVRVDFKFGTMIELPRAALLADELAKQAEFFSFGTNDLTQTTLGVSRDDAGSFLPVYVERGILPDDPFVSLDKEGVGELVRIAVEKGRVARSEIHFGVCGEHGGDPKSIEFCESLGLSYVSCSPFRVPIARVAAAQASLRRTRRYWR
ncbi:MAG TPA: pyruvate, phosphate dikinase [Polyangiaceae bacterium]|nr:pyruvate, phosphate dikinase [Polyangiaceae bacterium]